MDQQIATIYEDLLKWESTILNIVRKGNFMVVRLIDHSICASIYSVVLKPVDMSEDNPEYLNFMEWVKEEYPPIACFCDDYYYYDDWDDYGYEDLQDEIEIPAAKKEKRRRKKREWMKG